MRFDGPLGGSYLFEEITINNKGDGCEGWGASRSVEPARRAPPNKNWVSAHQAILHEKLTFYWVAQRNDLGRFVVVRDTSHLGSWYGRGFHSGGFGGGFHSFHHDGDHFDHHHDFDHHRDFDHHHHFDDRFFLFGFGYPYYGYPYYPYDYGYYDYGYSDYSGAQYRDQYWSDLTAAVQTELTRAGYYHGAIDGVFGPDTAHAVRAYRRAKGLPVTSQIDRGLLKSLNI
jgi:putative peptidoglycan binding protein